MLLVLASEQVMGAAATKFFKSIRTSEERMKKKLND
jgi:hypothetical protein